MPYQDPRFQPSGQKYSDDPRFQPVGTSSKIGSNLLSFIEKIFLAKKYNTKNILSFIELIKFAHNFYISNTLSFYQNIKITRKFYQNNILSFYQYLKISRIFSLQNTFLFVESLKFVRKLYINNSLSFIEFIRTSKIFKPFNILNFYQFIKLSKVFKITNILTFYEYVVKKTSGSLFYNINNLYSFYNLLKLNRLFYQNNVLSFYQNIKVLRSRLSNNIYSFYNVIKISKIIKPINTLNFYEYVYRYLSGNLVQSIKNTLSFVQKIQISKVFRPINILSFYEYVNRVLSGGLLSYTINNVISFSDRIFRTMSGGSETTTFYQDLRMLPYAGTFQKDSRVQTNVGAGITTVSKIINNILLFIDKIKVSKIFQLKNTLLYYEYVYRYLSGSLFYNLNNTFVFYNIIKLSKIFSIKNTLSFSELFSRKRGASLLNLLSYYEKIKFLRYIKPINSFLFIEYVYRYLSGNLKENIKNTFVFYDIFIYTRTYKFLNNLTFSNILSVKRIRPTINLLSFYERLRLSNYFGIKELFSFLNCILITRNFKFRNTLIYTEYNRVFRAFTKTSANILNLIEYIKFSRRVKISEFLSYTNTNKINRVFLPKENVIFRDRKITRLGFTIKENLLYYDWRRIREYDEHIHSNLIFREYVMSRLIKFTIPFKVKLIVIDTDSKYSLEGKRKVYRKI